jgi:hypothetical protein
MDDVRCLSVDGLDPRFQTIHQRDARLIFRHAGLVADGERVEQRQVDLVGLVIGDGYEIDQCGNGRPCEDGRVVADTLLALPGSESGRQGSRDG